MNIFIAYVFIIELNSYDMVLSIQWLAILGDIVSYYNEMCMSFNWKGQEVIRGDSLIKLQTIIFE